MTTGSGTLTPASSGSGWHYTTKTKVNNMFQSQSAELQDEWIQWVEDLIDDWTKTTYVATASYADEVHSGDGTPVLFVDHPPIVSVSDLKLEVDTNTDLSYTSADYKVFDNYIELINWRFSDISNALYQQNIFPEGVGNIKISYVGGSGTVPAKVEMCATMMVGAIYQTFKREGGDQSLRWGRVTRYEGDNPTTVEQAGLLGTLENIMKKFLPRGIRFQ